MIRDRRLPVVVLLLVALAGIVNVGRGEVSLRQSIFTEIPAPRTPAVSGGDRLSTTYFCAGSPSTGEGVSGEVIIANPAEAELHGTLTVLVSGAAPIVEPFVILSRSSGVFALSGRVDAAFVGATVELVGSVGVVEQRVTTPSGVSMSPCANEASTTWYFADGSTLDGVDYVLLLSNPFADTAVVDIGFVTATGTRNPTAFQGFVIPPQSVTAIDIGRNGAKDEAQLSLDITSRRGRIVAAKAQSFAGGGRGGYVMALGSPSLGSSWTFADGELGEGITESLAIFNPTDEPVDVDVTFLPGQLIEGFIPTETRTIERNETLVLDVNAVEGLATSLPTSRHATIVRTLSTDSIVVERVLTKTVDEKLATSVVLGSRIVSSRWWVPTGVTAPTESALVLFNTTGDEGVVTVSQVGPGGAVPIPGLEQVPIVPGGIITIDLTAAEALNVPVLVTTDGALVVVEQRTPRVTAPGRSGALAIPE